MTAPSSPQEDDHDRRLGVDLDVPASSMSRISFDAPPGTYTFVCHPHEGAMEGTLTVR